MRLPRVTDALSAAGVALVSTGACVDITNKLDDRVYSRASFDMVIAALAIDQEAISDGTVTGTIGSVEFASDNITDDGGQPLNPQVETTVTGG